MSIQGSRYDTILEEKTTEQKEMVHEVNKDPFLGTETMEPDQNNKSPSYQG